MATPSRPLDDTLTATGVSIGAALSLLLLGAIAALVPLAVGIAISIFMVWLIVFSGMAHLVHAWDMRGDAIFFWRLFVGILYCAGGVYLLLNPDYGLPALTLFIGGMCAVEALLLLVAAFWLRRATYVRWIAADGAFTLLLAAIIFVDYPALSAALLGVLVGLNLLSSGLAFMAMLRSNRLHSERTAA